MPRYSVHIWVTPIRPVMFSPIEAKNMEEAWTKLGKEYNVLEHKGNFGTILYNGNNGRVYRRKVKLTRLK